MQCPPQSVQGFEAQILCTLNVRGNTLDVASLFGTFNNSVCYKETRDSHGFKLIDQKVRGNGLEYWYSSE